MNGLTGIGCVSVFGVVASLSSDISKSIGKALDFPLFLLGFCLDLGLLRLSFAFGV